MWEAPTGKPYLDLQALVADKSVFVLTTNVDQQFFRVFPKKQICAFQGDFSYCQCSQPCLDDIWENSELVKKLTGYLVGVRLPEEAVPRCLDCGRVLEELNKTYVVGARARGVREKRILYGSVLKASMLTIVTLLALSIGSLLGGTAIVESIFMWDGVGKMAVDAILTRDYPVIQAYVIWMAVIYVMVNLVTDLIYHYLDPRIRMQNEQV